MFFRRLDREAGAVIAVCNVILIAVHIDLFFSTKFVLRFGDLV